MSSPFSIPSNIKQRFLPFVLNKSMDINGSTNTYTKPQIFSFKPKTAGSTIADGKARLNIFPTSVSNKFNVDISGQLLYNDSGEKKSVKIDNILDAIPSIQIREYLPDLKIDQALNIFITIVKGIKDIFTTEQSTVKWSDILDSNNWKKVYYTIKHIYNNFANMGQDDVYQFGNIHFNGFNGDKTHSNIYSTGDSDMYRKYIMDFPYTMYYKLQSSLTTNLYEIPGITTSKALYSSNGSLGWTDARNSLSLNSQLGNLPFVGPMIDALFGNIGINYTPWWKASSGSQTKEPQIDIEFDLFNDTLQSALANFIFVNTIVPGNRWLQYNIFQHSSNIYDVKLEGYNRLFACAADMCVSYKGNLRTPSNQFFVELSKHANSCVGNLIDTSKERDVIKQDSNGNPVYANSNGKQVSQLEALQTNNVVKIPDIYHVKISFTSLLPANFNNYLFTISNNKSIVTKYESGGIRQESELVKGEGIKQFITNVVKNAREYYTSTAKEYGKSASFDVLAAEDPLQANKEYLISKGGGTITDNNGVKIKINMSQDGTKYRSQTAHIDAKLDYEIASGIPDDL